MIKNTTFRRVYAILMILFLLFSMFIPLKSAFANVPHTPITDDTKPFYVDGILIISKEYPIKTDMDANEFVAILNKDYTSKFPNNKVSHLGHKSTKKDLDELMKAINSQKGFKPVYIVSGHRTISYQKGIYVEGNDLMSKPGYSEHHSGFAFDITTADYPGLSQDFGNAKEGKWLAENAHKYGFIIRYEKGMENITGYRYEPWHIRHIGKEKAKQYKEGGYKTLEEFLGIAKDYSSGEGVPVGDQREDGEDGGEGNNGTFGENENTAEKRDPFDPFLENYVEPSRTGVKDGSIVIPPTVLYGFSSLTQKFYKFTLIATQVIMAFTLILLSLQVGVIAYRVKVGESNAKFVQKSIDLFTGKIPPENLMKRILINMLIIVFIFSIILTRAYVWLWAEFYNAIEQVLSVF